MSQNNEKENPAATVSSTWSALWRGVFDSTPWVEEGRQKQQRKRMKARCRCGRVIVVLPEKIGSKCRCMHCGYTFVARRKTGSERLRKQAVDASVEMTAPETPNPIVAKDESVLLEDVPEIAPPDVSVETEAPIGEEGAAHADAATEGGALPEETPIVAPQIATPQIATQSGERFERLQDQFGRMMREQQQLENDLAEVLEQYQLSTELLDEQQETLARTSVRLETLQQELAQKTERLESIERRHAELTETAEADAAERARLEAILDQERQHADERVKTIHLQMQEKIEMLKKERDAQRVNVRALRAKSDELAAEVASLRQTLQQTEQTALAGKAYLKEKAAAAERELEDARQALANESARAERLQAELEEERAVARLNREKADTLDHEMLALQKSIEQSKEASAATKNYLKDKMRQTEAVLKKMQENLENESSRRQKLEERLGESPEEDATEQAA